MNTRPVPVAMIHGADDGRATYARAVAPFGILEASKALITIDGLNHWGIGDLQNPPGTSSPDPNVQARPQDCGIAKTARAARMVFDAYLKGDPGALQQLRKNKGEPRANIEFVE